MKELAKALTKIKKDIKNGYAFNFLLDMSAPSIKPQDARKYEVPDTVER